MAYSDIKEMLHDARNFASGAHDQQTVNLLKDIQLEVYDLMDENRELRLENEQLKNVKAIDSELKRSGNFLKKKNDVENFYCMFCWDNENKLLRTVKEFLLGDITTYRCINCKYSSSNYGQ